MEAARSTAAHGNGGGDGGPNGPGGVGGAGKGKRALEAVEVAEVVEGNRGDVGGRRVGRRVEGAEVDPREVAVRMLRSWVRVACAQDAPGGQSAGSLAGLRASFAGWLKDAVEGDEARASRLRVDVVAVLLNRLDGLSWIISTLVSDIPPAPEKEQDDEDTGLNQEKHALQGPEVKGGDGLQVQGAPGHAAVAEGNGPQKVVVPDNNLVDIIGKGRSFHFTFCGDFIDMIPCPMAFSWVLKDAMYPALRFMGEKGIVDNVAAYSHDGRIWFAGSTWSQFVVNERIVRGDVALFVLLAPHHMYMCLYRFNGNEKPWHQRPHVWNRDVAYAGFMRGDKVPQSDAEDSEHTDTEDADTDDEVGQEAPLAAGVEVPEHLRAMDWLLAPFLPMTGSMLQTFSSVWANYPHDFPMYGIKFLYSHTESYSFTFGVTMSKMFPEDTAVPAIFYRGTDPQGVRGCIRRYKKQDQNARINKGWKRVVREFGFYTGQSVVFCMTMVAGELLVRLFVVPDE